jgi:hypothetical protein
MNRHRYRPYLACPNVASAPSPQDVQAIGYLPGLAGTIDRSHIGQQSNFEGCNREEAEENRRRLSQTDP